MPAATGQDAVGNRASLRRSRYWSRRVAAVSAIAVVAAACGSAVSAPIQRISTERAMGEAIGALGGQKGVTLTFSLGVNATQVRRFESREHAEGAPAAVATNVPRLSVVIDIDTGGRTLAQSSTASKMGTTSSQITLEVGATAPVQLRTIGQTLYVRADVPSLLADFGAPVHDGVAFMNGIRMANTFLPGATAFGAGRWVSGDLGPLFKRLRAQSSLSQATAASKATDSRLVAGLEAAASNAFRHHTSIVNSGDHGGRTEYTVSIASRAFIDQLLAAGRSVLSTDKQIAPLLSKLPTTDRSVPQAQRTVLQVWVEHNKVEEIDLDLNQFKHALPFAVPLRVVIGPATAVTAPSGATSLDLTKLFEGVFAARGQVGSATGGSGGISVVSPLGAAATSG